MSPRHVAVLGGGIGGMAAAWYLAEAGRQVTLFEASDRFGGLGTFFEMGGRSFERFYHVMLPSDGPLLSLLDELGIGDRPYWRQSSFAIHTDGRLHPLDTAFDLLRFRPLPFQDRIRLGLTALYGRWVRNGEPLDRVTVQDWLTRVSGPRAFAAFWKPLLQAKFGSAYDQIPALWYWARFNREKNSQTEVKGYPRGGYRGIVEALVAGLLARGVELRLETAMERLTIGSDGRPVLTAGGADLVYDQVLSTVPLPVLRGAAEGEVAEQLAAARIDRIDYQGALNVVLMLDRSIVDHYWVAVVDPEVPFRGLVESTQVLDLEDTGGAHLVYLANYLHRSDPRFAVPDSLVMQEYLEGLRRVVPEFRDEWILDRRVFRTPFVEPIYFPGFSDAQPPTELVAARVFLATTAQVYPRVTAWNSTVELAREVVEIMSRSDAR